MGSRKIRGGVDGGGGMGLCGGIVYCGLVRIMDFFLSGFVILERYYVCETNERNNFPLCSHVYFFVRTV